jgi:hypothetical protein
MLQRVEAVESGWLITRVLPWSVGAAAIVTIGMLLLSVRWGIVHDASLMFYIGREIAGGARTVADVFDMNMPLVHWLHAGIYQMFGLNELAWRVIDLATIGAICLLGYRLIEPVVGRFAIGAVVWILALHLMGQSDRAGQRDVLMLVPVLGAALMMARAVEAPAGALWRMAIAGGLLGLAMMLKPSALLFPPLMALALVWAEPRLREVRAAISYGVAFGAGCAVPCLLVVSALAAQGTLIEFISLWRDFLLPVYGKVRFSTGTILRPLMMATAMIAIAGAAAVMAGWRPRRNARFALLIGVVGACLIGYLAQGKGWRYQAAPYFYSGMLLTVVLVEAAWHSRKGSWVRLLVALLVPVASAALIVKTGQLAAKEIAGDTPDARTRIPYIQALIADLDRLDPSRRLPVQTYDTTYGAIEALLRTGRRQPTRFIYDFQFHIGGESALRDALRREFIERLGGAGPHLIVMTNQQWPGEPGFDRVDDAKSWPAFNRLLATKYKLVVERKAGLPDGKQYRIYRSSP